MSTEQKKPDPAPENKPDVKKPSQIDVFRGNLQRYETDLKALLAIHNLAPEKFMTLTLNAVKRMPKLLECDAKTLFGCILVAAEFGLEPNTTIGYCHILPYKRKYQDEAGKWKHILEAQFQIGYPGWLEIMYRNPKIESIESGVIYENEEWYYDKGKREPFSHKPLPPSQRGEKWVAVFAIAWLTNTPRPKVALLYKEDVDKIKKLSQGASSDYSPWNATDKDPFHWMARKTAIKQLVKELPKTREIERVYNIDNVVETGGTVRLNEEDRTIDIVDTGYMEDINKQEKLEAKGDAVANSVKDMIPKKEEDKEKVPLASNAGKVDKSGQTSLV